MSVGHNSTTEKLSQGLPERKYLPELHGVRGLALLGVVLFHLFGNGRVSGGIDIFLAVSGFLFTGMLLREATHSGGRIDFYKYLGRLVRRIVIPSAIVVTFTLIVGLIISPVTEHKQHLAEARASLLYFENFELINSQLAYGAAGPETSPFQHFWSLSVQGQFYLVWPVLTIVAVLIARRMKRSAAGVMAVFAIIILVISLGYAWYVGGFNQDEAYLMTSTRAWQFAFGALVALAGASIRIPQPFRGVTGWIGLVLIISCGFVLDGADLFPGPWALWPLLGLTLVLTSAGHRGGSEDPRGSATRFLSHRWLAWIGDHAYDLYLWHWPLIIFYLEFRGREALGVRGALAILAVTVVLAIVLHQLVEVPLKKRAPQRSMAVAAGLIALAGVGASVVLAQQPDPVAGESEEWDPKNYPGALATTGDYETPEGKDFLPAIENLPASPAYYGWDCRQSARNNPGTDEILVCEDPNEPDDPRATVVLAGGSHSGQWQEAFQILADENDWDLKIVDRSGCIFQEPSDDPNDMCSAWQDNFIEWLHGEDVDLVVTPGTRMFPRTPEHVVDGSVQRWNEILDSETDLLLIRGVPRQPNENIAKCIAANGPEESCGPQISQIADSNPLDEMDLDDRITTVDLMENVCPAVNDPDAEYCSPVVGNVAVWRDNSHLSNLYVRSLTPILEEKLREELPELF